MKRFRFPAVFLAFVTFASAMLAADPTGTWKWSIQSPAGEIETTLTLEAKDGKLTGAYSNQFGDTSISNASLTGAALAFDVVRDFGGTSYVVKYRGELAGDTITGTLEAPNPSGGEPMRIEWNAKRVALPKPVDAKPKG